MLLFFKPPLPLFLYLVFSDVNLMGTKTVSYYKTVHHLGLTGPPNFTAKQSIPDEACDVHVNEGSHQVLTVKAVHDTSMPWDCVGKVLCKAEGNCI